MVEIPLTEDILAKKPTFLKTFNDQLLIEGKTIAVGTFGSASTKTLYTVPENHVFYLTSVTAGMFNDGTGSEATTSGTSIFVDPAINIMNLHTDLNIVKTESNSITFPIPYKIEAGTNIKLGIGASSGSGFIHGIEVKKEIAFQ